MATVLTDEQSARLVVIGLRRAGFDIGFDGKDEILIYFNDLEVFLNDNYGYDPENDSTDSVQGLKRAYAMWQWTHVMPSAASASAFYKQQYEELLQSYLRQAVRGKKTLTGRFNIDQRVMRDMARVGIIIHNSDETYIDTSVTEGYTHLKQRTGYDPYAYRKDLADEAVYRYATWRTMSAFGGGDHAVLTREAERQWKDALGTWARAAAVHYHEYYFNDIDNRLRLQDFNPNYTDESRTTDHRTVETENSGADDIFSKHPVVDDQTSSTTTTTPVAITMASIVTDPESQIDLTSVEIMEGPYNGSVSVNATNGDITYTADSGFTGTDQYTFRIWDKENKSTTATVTVTVSA